VPELEAAETIHAFWPHVIEREVDIGPLLEGLHGRGKQIVLPVVQIFGPPDGTGVRLRHARFEGMARLSPNRWGILEPMGLETVPEERIDVVLVPALGADRSGHRLGFGLGYYDEWLARTTARTICPLFATCLVDALPTEPHDVPVQILVTEYEILRPDLP
jgi:5-formyltetrahydrofolate cyclo-ligase